MKRVLTITAALVCLLSVVASAQEPRPTQTPERTIIIDISVVEVNIARPEEFDRMTRDRLNALISEGKAHPITSVQTRARSGETASARVGQRVPIQTGTLPAVRETSTGTQGGAFMGSPQIQYENTGLSVNATPRLLSAADQIEVNLKLEMTGVDVSTGNLTPSFFQRSFSDIVRVRAGEPAVLLGVIQQSALLPQNSPAATPGQVRGNFVVMLTARVVD